MDDYPKCSNTMPPIAHFEHGNKVNMSGNSWASSYDRYPISEIIRQTTSSIGWPKTERNASFRKEILDYGY